MPKHLLTPEEYLEIERKAEYKSEYFNGEMFAMAGAGEAHNLLMGNLIAGLRPQLRSRGCFVYPSDMRVRVSPTGLYTYPDVIVVCGKAEFLDDRRDTLLNPTVILEVFSRSTEAVDRGRKFVQYRKIETLRNYVLVASDQISVEYRARQASGSWELNVYEGPEQKLELPSIGCLLTLAEIYEDVELI